jgi:type III pantothenate kinase
MDNGGVLAVDVGNIHTALALWPFGEGAEVRHWQLASDPGRTPDEYRALIHCLLAQDGLAPGDVTGCVVASVVPALSGTLPAACRSLFGVEPLTVGPGVRSGLRIRTENPREVGPDRIANAVAAIARHGQPVLVLDFTTALIIDVVSAAGDYVGAIIAPGMEIAAEALARRAAQLQRIDLRPPPRAIATETAASLQSGLVLGYVGLVEGLVRRARAEVGPAPVVATGEVGWANTVLDQTDVVDVFDPLLTLDGLRRIYERHHETR